MTLKVYSKYFIIKFDKRFCYDLTSKINNIAILPVTLFSNSFSFTFIRCLVRFQKAIGMLIVKRNPIMAAKIKRDWNTTELADYISFSTD